jgi:hypothetical protein
VRDDTLTTVEQTLSKAFAPKQQDVYVTLADYALELSAQRRQGLQGAAGDGATSSIAV